jgi:outer membrane protein assembly factor BamB
VLRPHGGAPDSLLAGGGWIPSGADCRWRPLKMRSASRTKGSASPADLARLWRVDTPVRGPRQACRVGRATGSPTLEGRLVWRPGTGDDLEPSLSHACAARDRRALFRAGMDHLTAIDIYNGRTLWQRSLPDVAHWPAAYRGSGVAVDETTVYVLQGRNCLLLDPATGETRATFELPREALDASGKEPIWEYLAVTEELLIGTAGQPNISDPGGRERILLAKSCFALQKQTGQVRWILSAQEGIDSNAIAIDDGLICLIDGRPRYGFLSRRGETSSATNEQPRRLLALDLANGRVRGDRKTLLRRRTHSGWTTAWSSPRPTPSART